MTGQDLDLLTNQIKNQAPERIRCFHQMKDLQLLNQPIKNQNQERIQFQPMTDLDQDHSTQIKMKPQRIMKSCSQMKDQELNL